EDDKHIESESITNQKLMLKEFVTNNKELELVSIKIDDGYGGSNFDRPAFKEMIKDIEKGKINCIVVKDFSRFGRDFIEVGKYLEEIFPLMNVRFISVNDNYDSFKSTESIDNLIIPFKNLINDSYLRDISLKIRSSFDVKRKKGEFIGSFVTYGYLKDSKNKNKIVIDEIASKVVQDIFKYRLEGLSADKIAKKLNSENILSPMEYKKSIGLNISTNFKKKEKALWSAKAIFRILQNPIYIGTLEQNKYTTPNHKIKKMVYIPKEEWIIVENNHEPIISKEMFESVQKIMSIDTRIAPKQEKVYLLSGLICCGECGSNLVRKNNGTKDKPYIYYVCNNARNKQGCIGSSIKTEIIEETVFETLKTHINAIISLQDIISIVNSNNYTLKEKERITNKIDKENKELKKYQNIKLKLYEDLKAGILTQEEFKDFSLAYNDKITEIKTLIASFENEIEILSKGISDKQLWIEYLKAHKNIKSLNRELVVNLIEDIKVYNNKSIKINFKYEEEYKNLISYLESNMQVACNG
uniref:recombinase family protein n=1 Tax=uncultured Tyzzerella sp. TaxID=2321398 RepID=UPI0029427FF3